MTRTERERANKHARVQREAQGINHRIGALDVAIRLTERMAKSLPAMLAGQERARARKLAAREAAPVVEPAPCSAVDLYRQEKARRQSAGKPVLTRRTAI